MTRTSSFGATTRRSRRGTRRSPSILGKHVFHAGRAGRTPSESTIDLHEGDSIDMRVPPLEPLARETPSQPIVVTHEHVIVPPPPRLSTPRAIGLSVGSAGLLALGVGAGFVIASAATYASASSMCDTTNHCSPRGASIRRDALTYGDVASGLVIGGALALAGGIVVWFASPKHARTLALVPVVRF